MDLKTIHGFRLFAVFLLVIFLAACGESSQESTDQPVTRQRPQIEDGDPKRGEVLIRENGCGSCHKIPGIRAADGNVGPPLDNWADRQYIAGSLPNTPDNLIHWIRFPQAVEPGTVMPNLGIAEEDARDIAAYLYTLTNERQFTDVFSTPRAAIGGLLSGPAEEETAGEGTANGGEAGQHRNVPNTGQQNNEDQRQGEQLFSSNCAQCHGQNGEGQIGPALAGNKFVTNQDPAQVIDTVLKGRGQMPAFQEQLSNEQIAAVISYIRTAWENNGSTVSPAQIGSGQASQQPAVTPGSEDQAGQQSQNMPQPTSQQHGQASQPEQSGPSGQQQTPTFQQQAGEQKTAEPLVVMVELYEWGIDVSNKTIPAERVLFHVTNVGIQPHRFTIEGQGMELSFPEDIQVGQTRTILVILQPGNYRIFCPLEDHAGRGMNLEITAAEIESPALPRNQEQYLTPTQPTGESMPTPEGELDGQNQDQQDSAPQNQAGQDQPSANQSEADQQGGQVFSSNCAQCHGQNGEGQVGPALAGNNFVTNQDPAQVIDTVLHGRGQMPAFQDQLSNDQIAAVISFIRSSWGNSASSVSPDEIGGSTSSGDSSSQTGNQGQQRSLQTTTIDLIAQNRAFDKNLLTIPAGSSVTINMTNLDDIPHNFAIYQDSSASQAIFIGQVFSGPGQTVSYTFSAPAQPGNYFFRCDVHPFMNGEIRIE